MDKDTKYDHSMDKFKEVFKEDKIIKQFKKEKDKLVHPFQPEAKRKSTNSIEIELLTLGHLWLYKLVEEHGYSKYLSEVIEYSISKKTALFEWEIDETIEKEITIILKKHNIVFLRYLGPCFRIEEYSEIDSSSKNKDHPYCHLTRLLALAELGKASQIYSENKNLEEFLCKTGSKINAMYLIVVMMGGEKEIMEKVPEWFNELIAKNMACYHDDTHFMYYPKMDEISNKLEAVEEKFAASWYLIPDDVQVIISKFLYSIKIIEELSVSLFGLNGILSAVSTRIIFDNYWQTLYLINNNKIDEYRRFVLDRMRLHILKREDDGDEKIGELLRQVDNGYLDPIPVNGDYFKKSAREYAIELCIKDDYDKYYEFNSEFIHASLTAVYSGIMMPCKNPEHNFHLTIKTHGSRLIDSVPGIFDILNKHIELINKYCDEEIFTKFDIDEMFLCTRAEWLEYVDSIKKN